MESYDYIFVGAGCAGLSMVHYLLNSTLKNAKILIIDPNCTQIPNKTWCYWSDKPLSIHPSQSIHFWDSVGLSQGKDQVNVPLSNLKYFHLNSHDFFKPIHKRIHSSTSIKLLNDEVVSIKDHGTSVRIKTSQGIQAESTLVFDSRTPDVSSDSLLKQIFLGWRISCESPVFNPKQAVLMDFPEEFSGEFDFFYLLPFSEKEALIEYTAYSKSIISETQLQQKLESYLEKKIPGNSYEVTFRESGIIPMSTQIKRKSNSKRIIPIGTAAGWTKASTGYAFQLIQQNCQKLVSCLESNTLSLFEGDRAGRFGFYDNILLNIAHRWPEKLQSLFVNLFQSEKGDTILRFLSEETSIFEEVKLLSKLKFPVFIQSLIRYESH